MTQASAVLLTVLLIVFRAFVTYAAPSPAISVSGGFSGGSAIQPLIFTWNESLPVSGAGWEPGESVSLSLYGPLNSPAVSPGNVPLGTVTADTHGNISSSLPIPYDQGVTGPQAQIPRPGLYRLHAAGAASSAADAADAVNLCPATYLGNSSTIDWSHERGSRDGVLPGPLSVDSPERTDPNWPSVWDNLPVGLYGTVAPVTGGGANQPSRISWEDDPITHYAHDTNFYLMPDSAYRWTVGTANYFSSGEDDSGVAIGRVEVEWEALNAGNPQSYETGQIGMPAWVMPASGDRVYLVGRWVLDAGHPEIGDRTEIHPPRLVAVFRRRPAISSAIALATQVDIYVSGHGGAANHYPSGMDALLAQGGHGGGRLRDVLSQADQQTYYQAGPLPSLELPLLLQFVQQITGLSLTGPIHSSAGPTAFIWGTPAPEQQPVNDMDYDFDVPLPPPPPNAASVGVEAVTHSQHSTAVTEVITYPASAGALPAMAHIHLPYRGADNGIYARTLKFTWNTAPAPLHHFRVRLNSVTVSALPGEWHLWSDVAGQWTYLPAIASALGKTAQGQSVALTAAPYDVYLGGGDTLRVLVQGYRANCLDHLFGTLFGVSSYAAGLQLLAACGAGNNDDLGGALLRLPALPSSQGDYTVQADSSGQTGGGAFQLNVTVEYLGTPPAPSGCGPTGAAPAIGAAGVVGAGLSVPPVVQVASGGLISIFGQNFAPAGTARAVAAADLQDGALPANLACTCVALNQHLAPMIFVSPGQINVQAPMLPAGTVSAVIIANCGAAAQAASSPQTIPVRSAAPEFFYLTHTAGGPNPVAAINAITGAIVGPAGALPGTIVAPARPGDYVSLYLTGLGLTDPAFPPGLLANQAAPLAQPVSISLNGMPLPTGALLYAGAAPGFAGLSQVNIRIPAGAPAGNLSIALSTNGTTTPPDAYLAIEP
ncbi:MAG TPA: hypothetical protein VKT49_21340 [Bryobacteraceae bacterium]|nr:hypothetical protein [Bryobacteraceae bacterium]